MRDPATGVPLVDEQIDRSVDLSDDKRSAVRAENMIVARFWGGVEWRIVVTFAVFLIVWTAVTIAGFGGAIPLWLGLVVNSVLASTFYMPMHESVHGNISGRVTRMRWLNELVGKVSQVPLMMGHAGHRASHMKHHAFTNEIGRDPDFFVQGRLVDVPKKWLVVSTVNTFLPVFAFVPPARRLLPSGITKAMDRDPSMAKSNFLTWIVSTAVLVTCFALGVGPQALVLWYLPARIQMLWLMLVFAWFTHHPAAQSGRYVDTRVAVFLGSRFLVRGHDHHALHHLYPRVAHYRLRSLWIEMADDLVAKGVRSEGRALAATGPVVWC